MTDDTQLADDSRITDLATGFALGELSDEQLRELHACLQGTSDDARTAAQVCWQTLETTLDLRAALDPKLQDTVNHRVANPDPAPFLGGVFARLGWRRTGLEPISLPAWHPQRSHWIWISAGALLFAVIVITIVLISRSPIVATVAAITGEPRLAGAVLRPGAELGPGLISVPPTAAIVLDLPDGGQLQLSGSSHAVLQADGFSLPRGRAVIRTGNNGLHIGSPLGAISVPGQAQAWLETSDDHSLVASRSAGLTITEGDTSISLPADHVRDLTRSQYPWQVGDTLEADAEHQLLSSRQINIDRGTTRWTVRLHIQPRDVGAVVRIDPSEGNHGLAIGTSAVVIADAIHPLSGPPLQPRAVRIEQRLDGSRRLLIDGAASALAIPSGHSASFRISIDGAASVDVVDIVTGIDPRQP